MLLKCSLLSAIVERHTYDHQIASLLNLCMLSTRRCFVTYEETPILAYCRCFFSTYVVTVMQVEKMKKQKNVCLFSTLGKQLNAAVVLYCIACQHSPYLQYNNSSAQQGNGCRGSRWMQRKQVFPRLGIPVCCSFLASSPCRL